MLDKLCIIYIHRAPSLVLKIEDRQGKVLEQSYHLQEVSGTASL